MKIVFFGIGYLGGEVLEDILKSKKSDIIYIVTKKNSSDVIKTANDNNIPLYIVNNREDLNGNFFSMMQNLYFNFILVAGFHRIIPRSILEIPTNGGINIHFGKLPKWKGPISWRWAIILGESKFYVSFMVMTEKLDVGNILKEYPVEIDPQDNERVLFGKCVSLAKNKIISILGEYYNGKITPEKIAESEEYYGYLKTKDLTLTPSMKVFEVINLIRGAYPSPLAILNIDNAVYLALRARVIVKNNTQSGFKSGFTDNNKYQMLCRDGVVEVTILRKKYGI